MQHTTSQKILSSVLILVLVCVQFLPGFAYISHAEEGDSGNPSASSPVEGNTITDSNDTESVFDSTSNPPEEDTSTGESVVNETADGSTSGMDEEGVVEDSSSDSTTNNDIATSSETESETIDDSDVASTTSDTSTTTDTTESQESTSTPTITEPKETESTTTATSTSASIDQPEVLDTPEATSTDSTSTSTAAELTPTSTSVISTTTLISNSTSTPGTSTSTIQAPATSSTTTAPITATSTSTTTPFTSSSTPVIQSGDAVAMANILNILNANIVNSQGALVLGNFIDNQFGTIDLRPQNGTTGGCSLATCTSGIQVNLLNTSEINNLIQVNATTGANSIEGAGDATIQTGNAYAGLNLVNIANANFIDSQYLLVSLNAFSNVNGDIVFPGLSSFFRTLNPSAATQNINNAAVVENNVSVGSNAGNNTTDTASSTITTGNAESTSNIYNNINSTLSGGNTLHILFRVNGNWAGDIFGAPENFSLIRDTGSFYLTNGSSTAADNLSVNATNTSIIRNDISVNADTGNNSITNASSSRIETGNAFAAANILNVSNANVIGKNWMLAIINIMGDFNGNISFGRPDLWVGEQISLPSKVRSGSEVTYKFTVINNGDLQATQVKLRDSRSRYIKVISSTHEYSEEGNFLTWDIGTLPPGGAVEISYTGEINNAPADREISNTVRATERETDNNMDDNEDTASFWTERNESHSSRETNTVSKTETVTAQSKTATTTTPIDAVVVMRTTASSVVKKSGDNSSQQIIVRNPTSYPVRSVVLRDSLFDPHGNKVQTEEFVIGDLLPKEEVTIAYDVQFGGKAEAGTYTLSTTLTGTASSTRTFTLNGVITFLNEQLLAKVLTPKKAEASEGTTVPVIPEDEPTVVAETALLASAADSGINFYYLWAVLIIIAGSGLIWVSRKGSNGA